MNYICIIVIIFIICTILIKVAIYINNKNYYDDEYIYDYINKNDDIINDDNKNDDIINDDNKNNNKNNNNNNKNNNILTTNQLRYMSTFDKNMYIYKMSKEQYDIKSMKIIELAIQGKTDYNFTIMCSETINIPIEVCIKYDGYKNWIIKYSKEYQNDIQPEEIRHKVIKKLQKTFPDSKITKSYKNCCDFYKISWAERQSIS